MLKYLPAFLFLIISFPAQADNYVVAARVECMPELGLLTIGTEVYAGTAGCDYIDLHPDFVAQKYHLYNLFHLIEFDYWGDFVAYHPKTINCQLGHNNYIIKLEPEYWGTRGQQQGDETWDSRHYYTEYNSDIPPLYVSVERNGKLIIDKLSWNEWRESLKTIIVNENQTDEKDSVLYIRMEPFNTNDGYFFNRPDFLTITTESFYRPFKQPAREEEEE